MIGFEIKEIALSVLHSVIAGVIFAFVIALAEIIYSEVGKLLRAPREVFLFKGKLTHVDFSPSKTAEQNRCGITGELLAFFKVVLFALVYVLLSYYSLDGVPRLYTLVFMLLSFFLSRRILLRYPERVIVWLVDRVYTVLIIGLRIIFLPFKKIFGKYSKKNP